MMSLRDRVHSVASELGDQSLLSEDNTFLIASAIKDTTDDVRRVVLDVYFYLDEFWSVIRLGVLSRVTTGRESRRYKRDFNDRLDAISKVIKEK